MKSLYYEHIFGPLVVHNKPPWQHITAIIGFIMRFLILRTITGEWGKQYSSVPKLSISTIYTLQLNLHTSVVLIFPVYAYWLKLYLHTVEFAY